MTASNLVVDLGYTTLRRLLGLAAAKEIGALSPVTGIRTTALPHWVPNPGMSIEAGGTALAYTGHGGPVPGIADLARGADLLLAEAANIDHVPGDAARYLSSARAAGQQAEQAAAGPGREPSAADPPVAGHRPGRVRECRPQPVSRRRRHSERRDGG